MERTGGMSRSGSAPYAAFKLIEPCVAATDTFHSSMVYISVLGSTTAVISK
jgi:hypothetical protein